MTTATNPSDNCDHNSQLHGYNTVIEEDLPRMIPFEMIGEKLADYVGNNTLYGQQYHEIDTLRYGVNSNYKQPNPETTSFRYEKLYHRLKNTPEMVLHHCIWQTYDIDVWYISINDSLIPVTGNIHKHITSKR